MISFTHLTSTVGDLFPAKEICRLARERGILTLVDGAQTFGLLDVDLSDIQPDFYSGSAHKWPCGPKENGVLYINKSAQSKIWASIFSAYPGRVGVSRTFEGFGQRDEPAMIAFGEALTFQTKIGRAQIEKRSRELTQALIAGLKKIDGVKIWTSPDPSRSRRRAVVPAGQPRRRASCRRRSTRRIAIGCATRGGQDRPGIRFSPHFYNTHAEVDRTSSRRSRATWPPACQSRQGRWWPASGRTVTASPTGHLIPILVPESLSASPSASPELTRHNPATDRSPF